MICDFFSRQTYQLGAVFEFSHWVVGLKVCAAIALFSAALEFRKQVTYRSSPVADEIKGIDYFYPAQLLEI